MENSSEFEKPALGRAQQGVLGVALGKAASPQHGVGLDNLLQTLFSAPIAAIGVGMKSLHKFLIPRLYLLQGGRRLKIEHLQCLQLGAREMALRRPRPFLFGDVG